MNLLTRYLIPNRWLGILTLVFVAPADAADAAKEDQAVILSPFTVTSEKDTGYQATTTLAGTRVATELKDVGASISVITAQFLQDTAATDTRSLLTYVTGAEVSGLAGNFSGAGGDNFAPIAPTRLRGLAGATEARDFYNTAIPFDAYNIERVEVNRGANAVLFGTGSPAGIINSALKRATFKDAYSVETRVSSYESYRGTLDLNQQLIRGELALRLNGLLRRTRYQQDYAFENDDRLFGAVTYAPKWARAQNRILSGTVLRAHIEKGNLDSRRPRVSPPADAITYWFEPAFAGNPVKPTWDAANARTNSPASVIQLTQAGSIFRNPTVWFNDPGSSVPNTGSPAPNGSPITVRQGIISNFPSALYETGTGYWAVPRILADLGTQAGTADGALFVNGSLTDTSVFDYRNRLLEGPNRFEYADFEAFNVSLEQRFFRDRAGIEFAFDKQSFISGAGIGVNSRVTIDVNTTLFDGRPNPNFGRPHITGTWTSTYAKTDARVGRATAYYKLDTAELLAPRWARWAGRLTVTALHEQGEDRFKSLGGSRFASPDNWTYSNNQLVTDTNGGAVTIFSYLGPSLASATTARGTRIGGLTALHLPSAANGTTFQGHGQAVGAPFVITTGNFIDDGIVPNNLATAASQTGNNIRNQAAILQYKFLHDTLVVTSGWRRDNVDSFTAPSPLRGVRNNLIVNDGTWLLPSAPTTSVSDETQSRSAVLHVPEKWVRRVPLLSSLSARYNTSQNFRPGGTRFDSYGRALAPQSGNTKDVGFSLGLADDRVVLTATWFTTKQVNTTAASIGNLTRSIVETWRLVKNMEGLGVNRDLSQVQAPPQFLLDLYSFRYANNTGSFTNRDDVVLTQDALSQGAEFEVFVNLTRNWRVTANAARVQAVRSNTGGAFYDLFFVRKVNGQSLYENWSSAVANTTYLSEGLERLSNRTAQNANMFYSQALQDGGPTSELRKWRANLVTTYSFAKESRLRGVSVGSGGRWQDKVAIGFPYTNIPGTTTRIPNVRAPFFGPAELAVDAWLRYERPILREKVKLTVQLNCFNVLDDDVLIPIATQPTGAVANYRIPAERRYEFAAKFDF